MTSKGPVSPCLTFNNIFAMIRSLKLIFNVYILGIFVAMLYRQCLIKETLIS